MPGLKGLVHPTYPPYDMSIPDEADRRLARGVPRLRGRTASLPRLTIIRLGNDHTDGTRPGASDAAGDGGGERPRARPAGGGDQPQPVLEGVGDLRARGRRPERARPRGLAPLVGARDQPVHARGAVDSTLYTTSGMLRTIELILGLPPMSQYDAAATPMYDAFQTTPVLDAVRDAARARAARREERGQRLGRRGVAGHEPRGGGHGARATS